MDPVQPTADTYRALARSSPWRWRTLHFTRRGDLGEAEAWLRRPGDLLVRPAGGEEQRVHGVPYTVSRARTTSTPDGIGAADPWHEPLREPVLRPDGLVAERPDGWHLEHGDPMWENYTWTAMLDPDELSHHVAVDDARAEERDGRETWVARLRPEEGYEPRCGCCALLWSEISVRDEYAGEPERLARFAAQGYPDAYDVALDVGTGVVVALEPVGGPSVRGGFTLTLHEVDADLDAVFADRRP
jgi:hypothetical protein